MRILDKEQALIDARHARHARATRASRFEDGLPPGLRRGARHRPDRLGQVDDALRRAERDQLDREEHHHDRGPGRVPARGHQPDPGQPQGRAHLRRAACARCCAPTPTSSWSARSATARRRRSRSSRRSPATSSSPRCTPTTRRRRSRASPRWASSRSSPPRRSTASSPSGSCGSSARYCKQRDHAQRRRARGRGLPGGVRRRGLRARRLRPLRRHRLQGPARPLRGHERLARRSAR